MKLDSVFINLSNIHKGIFSVRCIDAVSLSSINIMESQDSFEELMNIDKEYKEHYYLLSYPNTSKHLDQVLCKVRAVNNTFIEIYPYLRSVTSKAQIQVTLDPREYLKCWVLIDKIKNKLDYYASYGLALNQIDSYLHIKTDKNSEAYLLVLKKTDDSIEEYQVVRFPNSRGQLCYYTSTLSRKFLLNPEKCNQDWFLIHL